MNFWPSFIEAIAVIVLNGLLIFDWIIEHKKHDEPRRVDEPEEGDAPTE